MRQSQAKHLALKLEVNIFTLTIYLGVKIIKSAELGRKRYALSRAAVGVYEEEEHVRNKIALIMVVFSAPIDY